MKAWVKAVLAETVLSPRRIRIAARRTAKEILTLSEAEIKVGDVFGFLVTQRRSDLKHWWCRCHCGTEAPVAAQKLVQGKRDRCKSCMDAQWFVRKERSYERARVFDTYMGAKSRCQNPKTSSWPDYGGRGIEFKFSSFDQFFDHLGPKPPRKSIDRIDNDGHYELGNVRWATQSEQARNTRRTKLKVKDVIFIRKARAAGVKISVLAKWFQVSRAAIYSVVSNHSWALT